ncbi:hypothetical protein C1I98_21195 [Spongiactinospora gelatinilytica]|uniref:Uncharacterized protein n=1 Tax=Spongiactinospora gelatinilytica TaxID=2666298 RepID=A0A2W2HRY3_9ACTN|nr:hypothetical protein C1I98_21195 [Spongiactinospora gelatinilytica]
MDADPPQESIGPFLDLSGVRAGDHERPQPMPVGARLVHQAAGRRTPTGARHARLGTSTGSKVPARSRGTAGRTGPIPICTVLPIRPLRELPVPWPTGSCLP